MLFGRNTEAVTGVPWTAPCACHACCVGGGIALAGLTVRGASNGVIGPHLLTVIGEGLLCCWMISSACLSSPREGLQKKYHLKVSNVLVPPELYILLIALLIDAAISFLFSKTFTDDAVSGENIAWFAFGIVIWGIK